MKKIAIQALCACLYMSILASCGAQRALHFARHTSLDTSANTIKVADQPVFKVSTSVLNLKEEQLALNEEALPKEWAAYIASILKECHSNQDTIIAASPSFTLVKSTGTHRKRDVGYMYSYQLDFESGRWVCIGLDAATESAPTMDGVCGFLRRIYVIKRRNRVIVKDSFGDIAIVYVLQGRDRKAPFSHTSAWRPADISAMISTAYYIQREFDPKSHAVATGRYVK
nr:hypothetical protein [uncultured Porphyromonas sp.]